MRSVELPSLARPCLQPSSQQEVYQPPPRSPNKRQGEQYATSSPRRVAARLMPPTQGSFISGAFGAESALYAPFATYPAASEQELVPRTLAFGGGVWDSESSGLPQSYSRSTSGAGDLHTAIHSQPPSSYCSSSRPANSSTGPSRCNMAVEVVEGYGERWLPPQARRRSKSVQPVRHASSCVRREREAPPTPRRPPDLGGEVGRGSYVGRGVPSLQQPSFVLGTTCEGNSRVGGDISASTLLVPSAPPTSRAVSSRDVSILTRPPQIAQDFFAAALPEPLSTLARGALNYRRPHDAPPVMCSQDVPGIAARRQDSMMRSDDVSNPGLQQISNIEQLRQNDEDPEWILREPFPRTPPDRSTYPLFPPAYGPHAILQVSDSSASDSQSARCVVTPPPAADHDRQTLRVSPSKHAKSPPYALEFYGDEYLIGGQELRPEELSSFAPIASPSRKRALSEIDGSVAPKGVRHIAVQASGRPSHLADEGRPTRRLGSIIRPFGAPENEHEDSFMLGDISPVHSATYTAELAYPETVFVPKPLLGCSADDSFCPSQALCQAFSQVLAAEFAGIKKAWNLEDTGSAEGPSLKSLVIKRLAKNAKHAERDVVQKLCMVDVSTRISNERGACWDPLEEQNKRLQEEIDALESQITSLRTFDEDCDVVSTSRVIEKGLVKPLSEEELVKQRAEFEQADRENAEEAHRFADEVLQNNALTMRWLQQRVSELDAEDQRTKSALPALAQKAWAHLPKERLDAREALASLR